MSKTFVDHGFPPLSSFRLIVPPLQLVSAALFEIVKQGAVMYYGVLEEFITTVLETAPELLTDTERLQLVIGLRAKVVLELCRNETEADWQDFQHHLSQMNTYITNQDKETSNSEVKASVTNFMKLVHTLVEDQCQRNIFFQIIFPTAFGPKYDSALQALMKKFLFNLQDLLPVPSLEQLFLPLVMTASSPVCPVTCQKWMTNAMHKSNLNLYVTHKSGRWIMFLTVGHKKVKKKTSRWSIQILRVMRKNMDSVLVMSLKTREPLWK
ncbi:uncharacterized protein LOC117826757 isoform X4 [Notolabrus celidotus]|uniref:uncharacterized protein LOC117826757 isoform X4 n=1 Tax=Notolabrus celidotus TaxID=1203425 RepID=UPI00148FBF74|nr:uncharacterized protein LOC117826757 isoform X4 [Notolabrus celidotus]